MSTAAPSLQDAYRAWLKIPADKIPPDHYTLLGLDQFETSDEKIRKATLERTKIVRPRCLKYHELGTQLLNEIAAASVCLTDSKSKAQYDERLKTGGVTAAAEMTGDASRNRQRLRELLKAAGRDAILDRAEGKPKTAGGKPDPLDPANHKPAARPAGAPVDDVDEDTDFDLTLEEEETLAGAGYSDPLIEALLAGDDDDFDIDEEEPSSPFALTPAKKSDLKEMASALALAGALVVVAVIAIGGFIAWRVAQEEEAEPVLTAASLEQAVASEIGKLPPQQFGLPPAPPTANSTSKSSGGGSSSTFPGAAVPGAQTDPTAAVPPGPGGVPLPATSTVPMPGTPAPASTAQLERFVGRLMRVECREKAVHLLVRQDQGSQARLQVSAYSPTPSATWVGNLEAIVEEPDFEDKIIDYRTMEEGLYAKMGDLNQIATLDFQALTNNPELVLGQEGAGDIVEVFGTRTTPPSTFERPGEQTAVFVKLERIQILGGIGTEAAIGLKRESINPAVHASRSEITKLLRSGGDPTLGVSLKGTVLVPLQGTQVIIQTGTASAPSMQMISLDLVTSYMVDTHRLPLSSVGTVVDSVGKFNRKYDNNGMPIFEVTYLATTAASDVAAAPPGLPLGAPGGNGPGGVGPAPMPGAGQPGLAYDPNAVPPPGEARMPPGGGPGGGAPAQGAGFAFGGEFEGGMSGGTGKGPPAVRTVPEGGRFYVIQYSYADAFTPRTLDYQIVQGVENRKTVVATLKAQGYKAYAHTTSYKTQEDAEAYVERQYAKQNR